MRTSWIELRRTALVTTCLAVVVGCSAPVQPQPVVRATPFTPPTPGESATPPPSLGSLITDNNACDLLSTADVEHVLGVQPLTGGEWQNYPPPGTITSGCAWHDGNSPSAIVSLAVGTHDWIDGLVGFVRHAGSSVPGLDAWLFQAPGGPLTLVRPVASGGFSLSASTAAGIDAVSSVQLVALARLVLRRLGLSAPSPAASG